jgi:hypothetical protein
MVDNWDVNNEMIHRDALWIIEQVCSEIEKVKKSKK